ncbi:MAG: hypothetical protein ACUVV6_07020 [Thermoplasmatota archaeon]
MPLERNDRRMLFLGLGVAVVALALAGAAGGPGPGGGEVPFPPPSLVTVSAPPFTGTGEESSETTFNLTIEETNLVELRATLTWQDEAASRPGLTNEPDALSLTVSSPEGESKSASDTSSSGSVTVTFTYNVTEASAARNQSKRGTGGWNFVVEVGSCGDQEPLIPDPLGLRTVADTGNAFTLTVSYSHYVRAGGVR